MRLNAEDPPRTHKLNLHRNISKAKHSRFTAVVFFYNLDYMSQPDGVCDGICDGTFLQVSQHFACFQFHIVHYIIPAKLKCIHSEP